MARISKTKYALLGLLSFKPMSGYDMKKYIERSLGYFWGESYGQIYPIINSLAQEGFAVRTIEEQEGKPDRHVYSITDKGRQEFQRWLQKPCEPLKVRVEALLKLFYAKEIPSEVIISHIQRFRQEQEAMLATYQMIEQKLQDNPAGSLNPTYGLLTVRCGLYVAQAYLHWCDETLTTLQAMAAENIVKAY